MKTILIIEDEKEVSENIKFVLEKEYKVQTSFSGNGGLDILKKEKVSLVVLDYMLPDIDGIEVLKKIKEDYRIPVIMMTAYGDKEIVLKCLRYRADWYFDKPFGLKDLREKVRELLKPSKETLSSKETFPFEAFGLDPSRLSHDVLRTLKLIGKNLSNPKGFPKKMILQGISEITSVTPMYFSRLFKKECGRSIGQIINMLKVEKAKELLWNGEKDIKEIAHELGFKHPNNLSRLFKRLTGNFPSELRK